MTVDVHPSVDVESGGGSVSVSGQVIYLISGHNEVTATVNVPPVTTNVSGQVVYLASGFNEVTVVIPPVSTNVSGQVVYLASGNNNVQMSGQAVRISGETIQIAGGINVSGSPVRISGETVYLVSGQNNVQNSGQAIRISGQLVVISGVVGTSISGQPVLATTSVSGNAVRTSGEKSRIQMFDLSGNSWLDLIADKSGGYRLQVAVSGESVNIGNTPAVLTSISGNVVVMSGNVVVTTISGNIVNTSGQVAIISGQPVLISGQTVTALTSVSGNMVSISGQPVKISGEKTRIQVFDQSGNTYVDLITNASGQQRLQVTASGDTVNIGNTPAVTTSVSGNAVAISGQAVRTSGDTAIISGQPVGISGQAVLISGQTVVASVTTNISGQTVYLASGQNNVQNSGQTVYPVSGKAYTFAFDPSGNTWNELYVHQSGGHKLSVDAAVTAQANISGQTVYLASGNNSVQNSGQTVYPVSGKAYAFAFDPSGQTWNELYVHVSGGHKLSVDATVNATAQVSGQVVYLTSGQNAVQMSGQAVLISGQLVAVSGTVAASVSGNMVSISGQPVTTSVSGNVVVASVTTNISGQTVYLASGQNASQIYGYIQASGEWQRVQVTQSGQGVSGIPHKLVVAFSGDPVSVSGNVLSMLDPIRVLTSGSVSVSGNVVQISGQVVNTSGQIISHPFTNTFMFTTQDTSGLGAVPASGGNMFTMHHTSGSPLVKLKALYITNVDTTIVSGQILRLDMTRTTTSPTGGTAISAVEHDPGDSTSGVAMVIMMRPTNLVSGRKMFPYVTTNTGVSGGVFSSGAGVSTIVNAITQGINIIPQSPEWKEIILRSGHGVSLQQSMATNYTAVTSGRFIFTGVYTVE